MPWDDGLEQGQPAHAIASDSALLVRVLAGPGTGKSFAMKRRVARLLEEGAAPERLLAVTFTRMASEDLVREIRSLEVPGSSEVHAGTLHSLCFKILSSINAIQITGRHPRTLARYEMKPLTADLKALNLGGIRAIEESIRAYEAAWARLQSDPPGIPDPLDLSFESALLGWLRFHRGMLIGELVPFAYHYLKNNPASPHLTMFDEVLVDEYQDLNKAEQEVVKLLASACRIVVVGDDDQSIYGFKYAHPSGIQEFGSGTPDPSYHELDGCYRSPRLVVEMANRLISHNQDRVDTSRFLLPMPANGDGLVNVRQFEDLAKEADWLRDQIVAELGNGVEPAQIIVLCPNRFLARPLLGRLRDAGVPVRFCFEEHQLDSAIAAKRLAQLGWLANKWDRISLRYLIGEGSASWLAGQWRRLVRACREENKEPYELLDEVVAGRTVAGTHRISAKYKELIATVSPLGELTGSALVEEWLSATGEEEEQLMELRAMADAAVSEDPDSSPSALSEALVDQISQPEIPDEVSEVRIMSLHKSKGLSAHVVAVTGAVEGAVPRHPPEGASDAVYDRFIEEQRRLFYVAITRVKADPSIERPGRLIVTSLLTLPKETVMRSQIPTTSDNGGYCGVIASRFLSEIAIPED